MRRQVEVTLGSLLGLAVVAAGTLVWGQQSGRLPIFGDAFLSSADVAPLAVTGSAVRTTTPNPASSSGLGLAYTETFQSQHFLDIGATTADWNIDARNLAIPAGLSQATGQSLTIATVTADQVRVHLTTTETKLSGSSIYYAISDDGGRSWQPILAGQDVIVAKPAADWRWRAQLRRGAASVSPTIEAVNFSFTPQTTK